EAVHSSGVGHGAIDPREFYTVLQLLLRQTEENEKTGNLSEISVGKLKRTLTRVLRGISEQPRTNVSPDIRITGQGKALLKLLTVRYADFLSNREGFAENPTDHSESITRRYGEIVIRPIHGKEGFFGEHTRERPLPRGSLGSRLDSRTLEELNKIIKRAYSVNSAMPQDGSAEVKSAPMVMLIPPTETDAYRANDGYTRQLPLIEYKRNQPREQTEPMPQKRPKVINRRQTQTDTPIVTGRLENFSREEINRLADKIYAQIETRVLRERRRVGM
ncbi:MAG: hypothetical protein K2N29_04600, partial [Ruminiclostridium sp.]|nr:hypothetical protein [Ruminiclostridium sp.]